MFKIYKIQEGEKIEDIADRFSTTKDNLFMINGYDRNYKMDPGQLVIVPNNELLFSQYFVKKGDSIYDISKRFNTDVDTMLLINGLDKEDYIYPNQALLVPLEGVTVYATKDGDTLASVASGLKTSKESLARENDNILLKPEQIIIHKKEKIF